eukprot:scaffold7120_cov49-Cyclotella_meneghiniana.AAC.1
MVGRWSSRGLTCELCQYTQLTVDRSATRRFSGLARDFHTQKRRRVTYSKRVINSPPVDARGRLYLRLAHNSQPASEQSAKHWSISADPIQIKSNPTTMDPNDTNQSAINNGNNPELREEGNWDPEERTEVEEQEEEEEEEKNNDDDSSESESSIEEINELRRSFFQLPEREISIRPRSWADTPNSSIQQRRQKVITKIRDNQNNPHVSWDSEQNSNPNNNRRAETNESNHFTFTGSPNAQYQ